jgi:hypothetical protein
MERFLPGEAVTLTDTDHAIGHIVTISDDGSTAEILWRRRPGHDHDVTLESTEVIRRLHESDEGNV